MIRESRSRFRMSKKQRRKGGFDDTAVLSRAFGALVTESDRGLVVLSAALLDDALIKLHESFIHSRSNANEDQIAKIFEPGGALNSFGLRIRMAWLYGLISDVNHHDLEIIRNLRNRAAHLLDSFSFTDADVRQQVGRLKRPDFDSSFNDRPDITLSRWLDNPRFFLLVAALFLGISILNQSVNIHGDTNKRLGEILTEIVERMRETENRNSISESDRSASKGE